MISEIIRFLLVGLGSNLINFSIYYAFIFLNFSLLLSAISGYLGGIFFSYTLGRIWVFDQRYPFSSRRLITFLIVYAVGGLGMTSLIMLLTNLMGLDYRVSWLIGAVFATINNFFGQKYFVFRNKKVCNG